MSTFVLAQKNTGNDREAIQFAIEQAKNTCGTVLIEGGTWSIDSCVYLYENVRVVIDGATLKLNDNSDGIIFRNANAIKPYKNVVQAEQSHIVVSGKNGAQIVGGTIFLSNVAQSIIEGIEFCGVKNFAISLASVLGLKFRNLTFTDCDNAIGLGAGTRDCLFYDLKGSVKYNFFVLCDYMHEEYRRHHREYAVLNNLVRNADVKCETFAYMCGHNVERVVFSDLKITATKVAFYVKQGKHLTVSNAKVDGKLHNDDIEENSLYVIE